MGERGWGGRQEVGYRLGGAAMEDVDFFFIAGPCYSPFVSFLFLSFFFLVFLFSLKEEQGKAPTCPDLDGEGKDEMIPRRFRISRTISYYLLRFMIAQLFFFFNLLV